VRARVTEINRQLHETRRTVMFPEMLEKVAETRFETDVYGALMAETARRLAQMDCETEGCSDDGAGPAEGP
jgi:hypothetical protein